MTSTGFSVGLSTEKNSSRVLRPPGGGHTDIFGVRDNQNELVTPSKRRNHPQSTISSCFTMADEPKENIKANQNGNTKEEEVSKDKEEEKNEVDNGTDENKAPGEDEKEKPNEKQEETVTVPKRGRVPPGGYSSGLW